MNLQTVVRAENRLARAWYVKYPLDAYALGPYRFDKPVPATVVISKALESFGERPQEVWPTGPVEEVDEYEIELDMPLDDVPAD